MASEIDIQKHISLLDSSDDESDNEYDGQEDIELGFVNQVARVSDANELHLNSDWSKWDGGKVGGKPSWLNPKKIPAGEKLNCLECAHPMSFLLQIYCPLDEIPDAFHRSLYVFCCRNAVCSQIGSAKILRCQLPQLNNIYPAESGVEGQIQADTSLCALCGQRATFTCSACHVAQYCSKTHQKDHWSNGHKEDCIQCSERNQLIISDESAQKVFSHGSKWLFPEYEICIEQEPDSSEAIDENEAKLIADFEKNGTTTPSDENDPFSDESFKNVNQKELNDAIGYQGDQDKDYIRFLTRVALAKDQILRYARWQDNCILWEHSKEQLSKKDVPNCLHCGAPRQFEFQILPQLIFYLQVDTKASISKIQDKSCEWGTLVMYTCSQSCDLQGDYVEEFCYRQSPYTGN